MQSQVLVHVVIIGRNPDSNDYAIGLLKKDSKFQTLQVESAEDADSKVCNLCSAHIKASPDWYEIRKRTFVLSENTVHLIYAVTIPNNVKLHNIEWCSMSRLSNVDFTTEVEKEIILEGIR